jgi:hypothetical protein
LSRDFDQLHSAGDAMNAPESKIAILAMVPLKPLDPDMPLFGSRRLNTVRYFGVDGVEIEVPVSNYLDGETPAEHSTPRQLIDYLERAIAAESEFWSRVFDAPVSGPGM